MLKLMGNRRKRSLNERKKQIIEAVYKREKSAISRKREKQIWNKYNKSKQMWTKI